MNEEKPALALKLLAILERHRMKHKRVIILSLVFVACVYIVYLQVQLEPTYSSIVNSVLTIPTDQSYKEIVEKEISVKPKINLDKNKFLVFSCNNCGGWADRLKGLLSSYALALLLNRTFIIDIHQPCRISKLIDPNMVDWDQKLPDKINDTEKFDWGLGYNYGAIPQFETRDIFTITDKKYFFINAAIMYANAFPKNKLLENRTRELGY